jgi:ankyrin repeat protein
VKLLLDNGADPNQTFGQNETSPLDNAFIIGDLDIIRLLLSAKADLDYINSRPWTAVYYLWDPTPRNYATTASILNLCVNEGYSSWYITDYAGWTPLHRAAAYGNDNDLRKLFNLGVYDRKAIPRAQFNWLPIHCAARYGNVSTFLYLANETLLPPANELLDTRGWSFLHLAAASGSHEMIALLFELGFDPLTLTDYDSFTLPDELLNKELTAQTIAEHYGHADVYIKALKERQLIIHKDIDLEKIEKALVDLG